MAKKGFGRWIAFAALAGAAAAGVSYFLKYREFHQELEKDFRDFEDENLADEDFEFEDLPEENPPERNYVSLNPEPDAPAEDADASRPEEPAHEPPVIQPEQSAEAGSAGDEAGGSSTATIEEDFDS